MSKSYNPFTMWGSYVGLTFGLIQLGGAFLELNIFDYLGYILKYIPMPFKEGVTLAQYPYGFFYPVIGFLVGWGIQALMRKLRK